MEELEAGPPGGQGEVTTSPPTERAAPRTLPWAHPAPKAGPAPPAERQPRSARNQQYLEETPTSRLHMKAKAAAKQEQLLQLHHARLAPRANLTQSAPSLYWDGCPPTHDTDQKVEGDPPKARGREQGVPATCWSLCWVLSCESPGPLTQP